MSLFKQPRAVFAVAFACVVSFMGIGLVDPILPAISEQLDATPSQVSLLFTSYLVITAVAMLVTGWISSRIGAKRTLVAGLALVIVFSALAGTSDSISGIVGFRAGWGLGNALFIATSLAVIIASASGGFAGAIICYEAALGLGIAVGPLLGGLLGNISWRGPFYGVSALMAVALIATVVLVKPTPVPARKTSLAEPLRALRHRGLLTLSLTALCYNWAFFTVLGFAPFPMGLGAVELGLVFTAWGLLVAVFSVFAAPRLQNRFGLVRTLYANLALFAGLVLVIAVWTDRVAVLVTAVIVAGVFIGINNTVTTQAVMSVSPVPRPVASAAYGFVRFIGGGLAPFAAGKLAEHLGIHAPFYVGAAALVVGIAILATAHRLLGTAAEPATTDEPVAGTPAVRLVAVGAAADDTAAGSPGPIVAAVDGSPSAERIADTAGRLALRTGRPVHLLHVQESAAGEASESEDVTAARAAVRHHVDHLAARGVVAQGHLLLHADDHGAAGRMVAEYAARAGARVIVIGPPSHQGLAALVTGSVTQELWRHAHCHVLVVNPALDPPTDVPPAELPAGATA